MPQSPLIIFDCDGTLVDSETITHQILLDFLKSYGVNSNLDELYNHLVGTSMSETTAYIKTKYNITLPDTFASEFRQQMNTAFKTQLRSFPNVNSVLKMITNPVCVASNGPLDKITQSLKICELDTFFTNAIFSAYELEKWKPDPSLFVFAAKTIGFKPSACLVIEDSDAGLLAAKRAGMTAIFFNPLKRSTQIEFDYEIFDMKELQAIKGVQSTELVD